MTLSQGNSLLQLFYRQFLQELAGVLHDLIETVVVDEFPLIRPGNFHKLVNGFLPLLVDSQKRPKQLTFEVVFILFVQSAHAPRPHIWGSTLEPIR